MVGWLVGWLAEREERLRVIRNWFFERERKEMIQFPHSFISVKIGNERNTSSRSAFLKKKEKERKRKKKKESKKMKDKKKKEKNDKTCAFGLPISFLLILAI